MMYAFGFLLAFVISIIATKATIVWAKKYGFVDDPKRRHAAILHSLPIPRAGGIPVYLATFFGILILSSQLINGYNANLKHLVGIVLAGFFIVVMGTMDDKYDLSPTLRLISMFVFGLIIVGFGIGVSYVTNPFGGVFHLDTWVIPLYWGGNLHTLVVWADLLALFWIVALMNIVNWSSGVDGQNAGIAVIALLVLGFASLRYDRLSEPTALLAFITSGAYAGFLLFSAYPQKIMPGFGGSTFSGFMIAVLSILSGAKLATAMIVLAIPIIDAGWVFARRVLSKRNPMKNDRSHLHHYLLDIGWSKRRIAFFYWLICAILGILVLRTGSQSKVFIFSVVVFLFMVGFIWLRRLSRSSKQ